ncbi:hypothetical protein L1987_20389 [Smallanthus sonchifolius]|uniref:Uncharacterized protein n=1 Tax=Smallanthus sonchifolius TaxID=185202 RepID=A0ACB9ISG1_9ASTR|nr:hypothetical protein L1987_20389 [Smallanthus sonchifolius]
MNSAVASHNSFPRISFMDLRSSTLSEDISNSLAGSNLHVFTLAELKLISQSLSSSNFLGEGGFGPIHEGCIDDTFRPTPGFSGSGLRSFGIKQGDGAGRSSGAEV